MDRKGFTLIELLIVVVIIGILAAIALPRFGDTKARAAVSTMKADLRNLASVQEAYFMDYHQYATALSDLQANPYTYKYSGQNTISLTSSTPGLWIATASSPAAGAVGCSMSYHTGTTDDGAPVCS